MMYEYTPFAKEHQLFEFIKKYFIEDLVSSKNPTSRYDCYSSKFKSHIELKCRRKHYDKLIIEKGKYYIYKFYTQRDMGILFDRTKP